MLLLLVACVDPGAPSPLDALGSDVSEVLFAAEPTNVAAALTSVSNAPPGRLDPAGPTFGTGTRQYGGTVAVVDAGEPARVVLRNDGVRLLVWVDLAGRVNVIPETVWVDATGHAVDGEAAGIRVPAGTFVSDPYDAPTVVLPGWPDLRVPVAPELFDDLWFPGDGREAQALAARRNASRDIEGLLGGTVLRDDAGRELVQLRDSECYVAFGTVLARDEEGQELVLVNIGPAGDEDVVWVRGWIAPPPEPGEIVCMSGYGGSYSTRCGGWGRSLAPTLRLPAGALLYDAPDGRIVGVTDASVRLDLGADAGTMPGWEPVLAPSPWGYDEVWARSDDPDADAPAPIDLVEDPRAYVPEDVEIRGFDREAFGVEE